MIEQNSARTLCGYVAIIGRPNVGKSTLLNLILGQKLSITSKKPQTTRHKLLGIKSGAKIQALYVDTPGIHSDAKRALNQYMNRSARRAIKGVDVVVFVTDRSAWKSDDDVVAKSLSKSSAKLIIAVNKIDLLKDKRQLLPQLKKTQEKFPAADIVPLSAATGENISRLEKLVEANLPYGPFLYAADQFTDRSERFLVSEIIREKIMRQLGKEIPYSVTIQIETFKLTGTTLRIDALILVERDGQKVILIGTKGEKLKRIGTDARKDIEKMLGQQVMLRLWVKVKSGWADNQHALKSLGYDDV